MKRKFSRILKVGVSLAVVLSLTLAFAPVALAGSVSEAEITLDDYSISTAGNYTIEFDIIFGLTANVDNITVRFPSGTTVPDTYTADRIGVSRDGGDSYTAVGAGKATLNSTTRVAVITVPAGANTTAAAHMAVVFHKTCLIINPDIPGDYTLEVKTTEETTYKVSEVYTIGIPGMVTRYNSDGNFVGSYNNIDLALDAANDEDVLKVGPGTYTEALTVAATEEDVTIEATGTAAETIIKGSLTISATSNATIIDGLTLKGEVTVNAPSCIIKNSTLSKYSSTAGETLLTISGNATQVTDCTFDTTYKAKTDTAIKITGGDTITIDGCIFTTDDGTISLQDIAIDVDASAGDVTDLVVKNCTFDGTKGTGYYDASGNTTTVTVKDSSFDGFYRAFHINNTSAASTLTVRVNTIENSTKSTYGAIEIDGSSGNVTIVGNTIEDNAGYSVKVDDDQDNVRVIGNNLVDNVKGLKSTVVAATADHLKAENNWWGDASGPDGEGDGSGDLVSTYVDYKPYLATSISAGQTALAATSLDAKTVASVKVAGLTTAADAIWAAKYEANPEDVEPEYTALEDAWFDVYISGGTGTAVIKLYSDDIDSNTDAYAWSASQSQAQHHSQAYTYLQYSRKFPFHEL